MITSEVLSELKTFLKDEQIEDCNRTDVLGNEGKVTVYPKTEGEISSILKYANEQGKKVIVEGMGTKRGFGGISDTADLLLSLKKYKGVIEHSVGDMTMTVRSGTTFNELQLYLAEHQQMIPLDPAFPDHATIGGIISSNDSGPKRLSYGAARDLVIGLRVVYPNGQMIRTGGKVVKNVAGYDMNKLFIGSMGTLGVISEITLKLRPVPKYESVVLLTFPQADLENIRRFTIQLLDSYMEPHALELLSPSLAARLTGKNVYTLAIGFEDVKKSVHYQEQVIENMKPQNSEMTILPQHEAKDFWNLFASLSPNSTNLPNDEKIKTALKIGVKNLDVLQVIQECRLMEERKQLSIEAHGGLGHGLCTVILNGMEEEILEVMSSLTKSVETIGGYVVAKHLPLHLRKKVEVWGKKPAHFFLLEGIKAKIDPKRTLNEKRFVGGI